MIIFAVDGGTQKALWYVLARMVFRVERRIGMWAGSIVVVLGLVSLHTRGPVRLWSFCKKKRINYLFLLLSKLAAHFSVV